MRRAGYRVRAGRPAARTFRLVPLLLVLAVPLPAGAACKVAIAFGLDISSSVNDLEYRLQLDGLAAALDTREVIEAILSPAGNGIAAAAYEWSGSVQQDVTIPWTVLTSEAEIRAFAATLRTTARVHSDWPTAVGKATEFGARLLRNAPDCGRQVIDLSGDGENNDGAGPEFYRRAGLLEGITINGLVILGAYPDPSIYYRKHVIQGPGAFVAIAQTFGDYRDVMVDKLLREISPELVVGEGSDMNETAFSEAARWHSRPE